jgi:hypothetical protein
MRQRVPRRDPQPLENKIKPFGRDDFGFPPGTETARSFPRARTWDTSGGSPAESRLRPIAHEFTNRSGGQTTETMPTSTRPFSVPKKISSRPPNPPTAVPDDVFGGQPPRGLLGGGFSKIFDPRYRLSPRPRGEVFEFFGTAPSRFLGILTRGKGAPAESLLPIDSAGAPSSRERRTGTERQEEFPLPHKDHPMKPPPGSEETRELHNPSRGLDGRVPSPVTVLL